MGMQSFGVVVGWYIFNIDFKYPIFLTMMHMASCTILSLVGTYGMRVVEPKAIKSLKSFVKISCLAATFCASVVFGNASLQTLALSYNQMIGATTPFFTALLALLIAGKVENLFTYLTLIPVVFGILMSTKGELNFHLLGAIFCVLATALRALKSVLQGLLLVDNTEKMDPMNLLMYMAPISCIGLMPLVVIMEPGSVQGLIAALSGSAGTRFLGLIVINLAFAYFINLFNFLVTSHTSPLTLQVLGSAKGAVATFVSWLVFKNPVTVTGIIGYAITITGVFMYSQAKKVYSEAKVSGQKEK